MNIEVYHLESLRALVHKLESREDDIYAFRLPAFQIRVLHCKNLIRKGSLFY